MFLNNNQTHLNLMENLLGFSLFREQYIIPDSIDGWLRLIALLIPMYLVGNAAGEKVEKAMNEAKNEELDSRIEGTASVFLLVGFYIVVIAFWKFTDSAHISLFSPLFLLGYVVVFFLSLAYIFKLK